MKRLSNRILWFVAFVALLLGGQLNAFAQATAPPVVTGYISRTNCPSGLSSCFVQYGASSGSSVVITSGALTPATHAQSTALASNLVVKASAGNLYTFNAVADSTLDAATWYLLIFDATSLPANGAVTPAKCYAVPQGQATFGGTFGTGGVAFTTGITMGVSTTGCYTLTASTHAALMGDYQ